MSSRDHLDSASSVSTTALCRILALGQLCLVGVTWKLWTPQSVFPQVPLLTAACNWPGWLDWIALAVLVSSSVVLLIFAGSLKLRRIPTSFGAAALALFFILDQHRLQPWAWQFFLLALLISMGDDHAIRRGWVWLAISIYFWSAISKLDYTFCHDQGPALIRGLKLALGVRGIPNRWTESIDTGVSLVLALGELAVALLLLARRTRLIGLWAATLMHAMLLVALGPLGLNHSNGVLVWNVYFVAQDWMLFGRRSRLDSQIVPPLKQINAYQRVVLSFVALVALWPAWELVGYCDHWPGWAVYSARSDQTEIIVNSSLKIDSRIHRTIDDRLLIGGWSLQTLAVPVYPQHRFHVGVALDLAEHRGFQGMVILKKAPSRFSGLPVGENLAIPVEDAAATELNTIANSFYWNARPRRNTAVR